MRGRRNTGINSAASAASQVFDGSKGTAMAFTLTANTAISFDNIIPGEVYVGAFTQDVTGGRTLTPSGLTGTLTIDPTPGITTTAIFVGLTGTTVGLVSVSSSSGGGGYIFFSKSGGSVSASVLAAPFVAVNQCDGTVTDITLPPTTSWGGAATMITAGVNPITVTPDAADTVLFETSIVIPAYSSALLAADPVNQDWGGIVAPTDVVRSIHGDVLSLQSRATATSAISVGPNSCSLLREVFLIGAVVATPHTPTIASNYAYGPGAAVVDLPAPTAVVDTAQKITLKNLSGSPLTINPNGTDTIDGKASITLPNLSSVTLVWSGTLWRAFYGSDPAVDIQSVTTTPDTAIPYKTVDMTDAADVLDLPTGTEALDGCQIGVFNSTADNATVNPAGGQTIKGGASLTLATQTGAMLVYRHATTNWLVF